MRVYSFMIARTAAYGCDPRNATAAYFARSARLPARQSRRVGRCTGEHGHSAQHIARPSPIGPWRGSFTRFTESMENGPPSRAAKRRWFDQRRCAVPSIDGVNHPRMTAHHVDMGSAREATVLFAIENVLAAKRGVAAVALQIDHWRSQLERYSRPHNRQQE